MGELFLVLLVCWKSGPYGVPDQQGDTISIVNVVQMNQQHLEWYCDQCECAVQHQVALNGIHVMLQ